MFVPDRAARRTLPDNEEIRPPGPWKNSGPLYPEKALAAGCGPGTVLLRIVINTEGRISEIEESPLGASTAGPCGAAFRAAAEDAVRAWRFEPAEWRRFEPGEDYDGDGSPDFLRAIARAPVAMYLDVRFDFEVMERASDAPRGAESAQSPTPAPP